MRLYMSAVINEKAEMPKTVGERLRLWRKSSMLKLLDVKKMIGVSQGSLSDLENNKSLPSAGTLTQLCLKTDLNSCWLLTGTGPVARKVGQAEEETAFETSHLSVMQDRNLRELVGVLIKIYQEGGKSKKALLKGFLIGAAHEEN